MPLFFLISMHTIIISGAPGCGKGTQAKKVAEYLKFKHLSTGDILRTEINAQTELGKLAQFHIDKGNFVPDNVAIEMINNFIDKNNNIKGIVFDGFPRTYPQCTAFDKLIINKNIKSNICISIDVKETELKKRLLKRKEYANRPDDACIEIIEHRLDLYKKLTKPVTEYYLSKNNCKIINGNNNIEEVFYNIIKELPKY